MLNHIGQKFFSALGFLIAIYEYQDYSSLKRIVEEL
jgi:hypothetical protein